MTGRVVQINISAGGVPKGAIPSGFLSPLGIEGDQHAHPNIHGGPMQAVLLITAETVDELAQRGYPVFYGALGENLTTRGLDRKQIRVGQRLRVGQAVIEITKPRGPCSTLDAYGPAIRREIYDAKVKSRDPSSMRWGMSGFYASVVEPGQIFEGDPVTIEETLA
ncbi:MAG: MOSC domain-containing protein [Bryobacteraceae bacterium]